MTRDIIIQSAIDKVEASTYLEIGVQRGKNFFKVNAPRQIAVDPHFMIGYGRRLRNLPKYLRAHFYETTSDVFFERYAGHLFAKKKIDVAFIDGLHTYEQSLRDFENCLRFLASGGIILFHDCNPSSREAAEPGTSPEEVMGRIAGKIKPEWTGDVWKTIVHLRSQYPDIEAFVLDCDYGVGVARRGRSEQLPYSIEQIRKMTWFDLEKNRSDLLGLREPNYWHEFLSRI